MDSIHPGTLKGFYSCRVYTRIRFPHVRLRKLSPDDLMQFLAAKPGCIRWVHLCCVDHDTMNALCKSFSDICTRRLRFSRADRRCTNPRDAPSTGRPTTQFLHRNPCFTCAKRSHRRALHWHGSASRAHESDAVPRVSWRYIASGPLRNGRASSPGSPCRARHGRLTLRPCKYVRPTFRNTFRTHRPFASQ